MDKAVVGYRLRKSERARRVRLRVTLQHGLEVVIPARFDAARVPAMLEHRKEWIRVALERAKAPRALLGYAAPWVLPEELALPALGRVWRVSASNRDAPVTIRAGADDGLLVSGRVDDEAACRAALARWLMRQARAYLLPRLQTLSARVQLPYRHASIRRQRTRWGSCSPQKSISLNARLLFLPPPLVDYVLIHELCHVKEMNHSRQFWSLVAKYIPDFRTHDKALRDGWERIPRWAA